MARDCRIHSKAGRREHSTDCAISFLCPENSEAPCQLLRLPEAQVIQKWRCGTVGRRGNYAGRTDPNKSWALQRGPRVTAEHSAACRTPARLLSARLSVLWKGPASPVGRHRHGGLPPLYYPLLACFFVGFLAPSFSIPQAHWFSNDFSFTLVSSYLAEV